jgi:hypothetical protein
MMWNITGGKQMTFNDEISNICPFDLGSHTLDQNHVRREQIRLTKVGWKYENYGKGL